MPYNIQTVSERNNALGIVNATPLYRFLVAGVCASGTAGTIYPIADIGTLKTTLCTGGISPACELAAMILQLGGLVDVLPLTAGTAASAAVTSTVSTTGNTGTSALTVTGTAQDHYLVRCEILTGGTAPSGTFRYSLDDGLSWVESKACGTSGVALYAADPRDTTARISTGLTIGWGAGTLVAGDVYTFSTQPAAIDSTALATALGTTGVVATSNNVYSAILVPTAPNANATDATNITAAQAIIAAIATGLGTLFSSNSRPMFSMIAMPRRASLGTENDATFLTALTSGITTQNDRIVTPAGYRLRPASIGNGYRWRSELFTLVERLLRDSDPSIAPYRVEGNTLPVYPVSTNSIASSTGLVNTALSYNTQPLMLGVTHDEHQGTAIAGSGFYVATSTPSRPGSPTQFSADSILHTDPTSDFSQLNYRILMDLFERIIISVNDRMAGETVFTLPATATPNPGALLATEAARLQTVYNQAVRAGMVDTNYIRDIAPNETFVLISTTNNVLATGRLIISAGFTPPAYIRRVTSLFQLSQFTMAVQPRSV